jgi:TPP-dependent pyruvate/acetoin dehydrogenase alpha subunit
VDGTDFLACAAVIGDAVKRARDGDGPQLIVAKLLRLSGHGEHDDGSYVPAEIKQSHYGRDCLDVAEMQLLEYGILTKEVIASMREIAATDVQAAVAQAQQEPTPDPYQEVWHAWSTERFYSENS